MRVTKRTTNDALRLIATSGSQDKQTNHREPMTANLNRGATPPHFNFIELERRGYAFIERCKYEEARKVFEAIALMAPNDRRGQAGLAITAECQWKWMDAIERWTNCLSLKRDDRDIQAIAEIARCFTEIGQ